MITLAALLWHARKVKRLISIEIQISFRKTATFAGSFSIHATLYCSEAIPGLRIAARGFDGYAAEGDHSSAGALNATACYAGSGSICAKLTIIGSNWRKLAPA
jgi:hypothetical protein